ncbi:unnamed protein product, partial [Callosobruchus maculatus]
VPQRKEKWCKSRRFLQPISCHRGRRPILLQKTKRMLRFIPLRPQLTKVDGKKANKLSQKVSCNLQIEKTLQR